MGRVRLGQGGRQLLSPARLAHGRRARVPPARAVPRRTVAAAGRAARSAAAVLRPQPPAARLRHHGLFGSYGAVLAEDSGIAALLLREGCRRARDAGLASFRLKGLGEEPAPT